MAKTQDVETQLREFNAVFNKLAYSRWSDGEVFHDLLDFMIACLSPTGDKPLAEALQKKYGKDYHFFSQMMHEMMKVYHDRLGVRHKDFFDGLGNFYEIIASKSKSSALGQFFTPESLCKLMAQIQIGDDIPRDITVNDPACGSGRLLLAFHALAPENKHYACDIDPICSKMTAINMCLHGLRGEVICGNSFCLNEDWRFGFAINRHLVFGVPSIEKISKAVCRQSRMFDVLLAEAKQELVEKKEEIIKEKIQKKIVEKMTKHTAKTGQLVMF